MCPNSMKSQNFPKKIISMSDFITFLVDPNLPDVFFFLGSHNFFLAHKFVLDSLCFLAYLVTSFVFRYYRCAYAAIGVFLFLLFFWMFSNLTSPSNRCWIDMEVVIRKNWKSCECRTSPCPVRGSVLMERTSMRRWLHYTALGHLDMLSRWRTHTQQQSSRWSRAVHQV